MIKRTVWPTIGFIVAGILYNSWPLGYWLNTQVSQLGLASELQAHGQPYQWLFIVLDVLSGLSAVVALTLLVRWHWHRLDWRLKGAAGMLLLFALSTIAAALLPMPCVPSLHVCSALDQDPVYQAHGGFSILNGVALVISVVLTTSRDNFKHWYGAHWASIGLLALQAALGLGAVFGYFSANTVQYSFILYNGLWLIVFPFVVWRRPVIWPVGRHPA